MIFFIISPSPPLCTIEYRYTQDLLFFDGCRASTLVKLPPALETINSPLDWAQWESCLVGHPDRAYREYLVNGIREGFRVGYDYSGGLAIRSSSSNMLSAREKPEVIREYLAKECSEGRVFGPLDQSQFPFVHTSPFGVIPKGSSGKWRLIVDMSAPEGASINDGISASASSLSYVSVVDAVRSITALGQGALLAKIDIKSAYRNVPIHPDDRWLMGMTWEGALYIDTTLPFGLRSAPKIFTALADAAEWIIRQTGVGFIIHYLDDFLVAGAPGSSECAAALSTMRDVFQRLGFPIAVEKLEGPTPCLEFLGFELDSQAMKVRLSPTKLRELQTLVHQWVGKKTCERRELESLVGKLAHASRVVKPGRTFMRRMFELLGGARRPYHHIRLNLSFRSDLLWWDCFLSSWNGCRMIPADQAQALHIWTDASGHYGCGAFDPTTKRWIQLAWPSSYSDEALRLGGESITLKELFPVVLACAVWGRDFANSGVIVHCDNLGAVSLVNSGYSRVSHIMQLLRCLFFIRAYYQIDLGATHIPGVENTLADAISRNNLPLLFSQVPGTVGQQSPVSPALLELLTNQHLDWTSHDWTRQFSTCFRQE